MDKLDKLVSHSDSSSFVNIVTVNGLTNNRGVCRSQVTTSICWWES